MAASVYNAARREELARRLSAIPFDRSPRWGRMTAPQMVTHLLEAYRMPSGELHIAARPLPLKPLLRWVMLYLLPFPKGAPTARELLSRKPQSWDADVAALRETILAVREPAPGAKVGEHPIFGQMSAKDWGVLLYKHTDHHLRQFGV